jgi:cell division protein ZapA
MPQVEIMIGGRSFEVACQDGEEPFLRSAAQLLDTEANSLSSQIGRMPEARMLLMAGLLLADKTAGLEDRLKEAEAQLAGMAARLAAAEVVQTVTERVEIAVEVPVEVEVIPAELTDLVVMMVERTEALADEIAAKVARAS